MTEVFVPAPDSQAECVTACPQFQFEPLKATCVRCPACTLTPELNVRDALAVSRRVLTIIALKINFIFYWKCTFLQHCVNSLLLFSPVSTDMKEGHRDGHFKVEV